MNYQEILNINILSPAFNHLFTHCIVYPNVYITPNSFDSNIIILTQGILFRIFCIAKHFCRVARLLLFFLLINSSTMKLLDLFCFYYRHHIFYLNLVNSKAT